MQAPGASGRQERCATKAHTALLTSDLLGVNELHEGRSWALTQVRNLPWTHEVDAGRQGCCTYLPYAASSACRPRLPPRCLFTRQMFAANNASGQI